MCELTGEMIQSESTALVRILLEQALEEVRFDSAIPLVSENLTNEITETEVNSICLRVFERENTFHSVETLNDEATESVVLQIIQNLAK